MLPSFLRFARLPNVSSLEHKSMALVAKRRIYNLMVLSKFRLSTMIAFTSYTGFALFSESLLSKQALSIYLGTLLTSFSASTLNQVIEKDLDRLMKRTGKRPVAIDTLSKRFSCLYALSCGAAGVLLLLHSGTARSAALSFSNIILYAFIYTPLKRFTHLNTLVGSIVGAIPPLIGTTAIFASSLPLDAYFLPLVIFLWQFPHFNSLSFLCSKDYANAGYIMAINNNSRFVIGSTFASSVALFLAAFALYFTCDTGALQLCELTALNGIMVLFTMRFLKNMNTASSKALFRYSLLYLPLVITVMLANKNPRH